MSPVAMETVEKYLSQVRTTDVATLVGEHPHSFLLVHLRPTDDDSPPRFRTTTISRTKLEDADREHKVVEPPVHQHLGILEIVKSPTSPWNDGISVGRARSNDLVIRDPSVSKLHGHFERLQNGDVTFCDAGSRNGSHLNGAVLTPGKPVVLHPEDALRLGRVKTRYFDAPAFFEFLRGLVR